VSSQIAWKGANAANAHRGRWSRTSATAGLEVARLEDDDAAEPMIGAPLHAAFSYGRVTEAAFGHWRQ